MENIRIGHGIDIHPFAENRKLILLGVEIDFNNKGLAGHSDADAATHALIDALLGATGLSDIGSQYPDTDSRYKNLSSILLLEDTFDKISQLGFVIVNIDITIIVQKPKISPYIAMMKEKVSKSLKIGKDRIGIKATTAEMLGFIGRNEGLLASATVLVNKKNHL